MQKIKKNWYLSPLVPWYTFSKILMWIYFLITESSQRVLAQLRLTADKKELASWEASASESTPTAFMGRGDVHLLGED